MDDQANKDAVAKQRIISHMNADHHDSIIRYLEHYHKLSSYVAYDGKLSDISLSSMTFSCGGKTYQTPLKPAMTSYREARERLVEMDKECVSALGRSDITIKEYTPPTGWYFALFMLVVVTLIAFSRKSNFAHGSLIAMFVPDAFRRFCWTIQPYIFYGMLLIHSAEMWNLGRGRLTKHNINIRETQYWLWMGDCFIEGVGAYNRFDKMVEKKRKEKALQKH